MIIESGVIIFVGLLFIFFKLPIKTTLRLLGQSLYLDIGVSVLAYWLHSGTFSGIMAAAVAGAMCSGMTSAGKWYLGCIKGGVYIPGVINIAHKIGA